MSRVRTSSPAPLLRSQALSYTRRVSMWATGRLSAPVASAMRGADGERPLGGHAMLDSLISTRRSHFSGRPLIALSAVFLMSFVPMSAAAADDEAPNLIENVQVVSTSFDAHTHLPTVVIELTCLEDAGVR